VPANSCDIDGHLDWFYDKLRTLLQSLGEQSNFKIGCGPVRGDMLSISTRDLQDASMLLSGCPCQPFAKNGQHKGAMDQRSDVLDVVVDWIVELAWRGVLVLFALENSPEMALMMGTGTKSVLEVLLERLRVQIPFFKIESEVHSLGAINIPHQRSRLWIRGLRVDALCGEVLPPPMPASCFAECSLIDVLDLTLPNLEECALTPKRLKNLHDYLDWILRDRSAGVAGKLATFDLDRAHTRVYTPQVLYDKIPTLRCKGPDIVVVSVADVDSNIPDISICRQLTIEEKFACHGHSGQYPSLFRGITAAKKAIGNAYAPPQLLAMVGPLLLDAVASGVITKAGVKRRSHDELCALIDSDLLSARAFKRVKT
jgi:site-specific DNA-cytosine methylase